MKIIAKTDGGYLCTLSYEEMCVVINGHEYTSSINKDKGEIGVRDLKTDTQINICEVFKKLNKLQCFKAGKIDYDSARRKLSDLMDALTPIENYVIKAQEEVKLKSENK